MNYVHLGIAVLFLSGSVLASPVFARDEKSAEKAREDLSQTLLRFSDLEQKLRELTGEIERLQKLNSETSKQLSETQKNNDVYIKSMERDIQLLKNAVKKLSARKVATRRPPSSPNRNDGLQLAQKKPDDLYDYAINQLIVKKKYGDAQKSFETFVRKYPEHKKAGHSLYWLGESFWARGDYRNAAQAYLRCFNSYSTISKAPDCLLKLGMALASLNEWDEACSSFNQLRLTFPAAPPHIVQRLNTEYERIQCGASERP